MQVGVVYLFESITGLDSELVRSCACTRFTTTIRQRLLLLWHSNQGPVEMALTCRSGWSLPFSGGPFCDLLTLHAISSRPTSEESDSESKSTKSTVS